MMNEMKASALLVGAGVGISLTNPSLTTFGWGAAGALVVQTYPKADAFPVRSACKWARGANMAQDTLATIMNVVSQVVGAILGLFFVFMVLNSDVAGSKTMGVNAIAKPYEIINVIFAQLCWAGVWALALSKREEALTAVESGIVWFAFALFTAGIDGVSGNLARSTASLIWAKLRDGTLSDSAEDDFWVFLICPFALTVGLCLLDQMVLSKIMPVAEKKEEGQE